MQLLQRGLERFGLAVGRGAFAVGLRLFGLLLLVLAHGFVQLLQALVQRGKERIEGFAQLVLGFVLLIHRFFVGVLLAVLLVAGLEFVEAGPLLHEFGHGLFPGGVVQHFQQLRGDGFDAGLVFDEPFHARREVAVNELHELFAAAFVELADDGDVLNLLVGELAVGAVNLGEDVPGINEEDAVVGLGLVEEPERGRERDGVEHVRGQRQHARR